MAPRQSTSPVATPMPAEDGGGEHELGGAQPEDRAPHREQARELELEADQEQQQHDAELGHRQDRLRVAEQADAERADDDAGRQIGDDRRRAAARRAIGTLTTAAASSTSGSSRRSISS